MVARFHYDDAVYQRVLADRLTLAEQKKVTTHIEKCETCQSKLESISQTDLSWDDVQMFLQSDESEINHTKFAVSNSTFNTPNDLDIGRSSAETVFDIESIKSAIGFLKPTNTPTAIGTFGRYEIQEILGRGGMGIVMKGYDPALARYSAIKVLAPELATNAAARRRFSREAKSAAAVIHENVVPIQNVDEENGLPYLVMPVIEGKSLQERVSTQRGTLDVAEILRMGSQIASGLAAAHAQGLVHRDVKPANILLENGVERVMISDFGLARAADDANLTRSQVISGTPQYMSPEQARGIDIDCRSDLFSLGSVLYYMCTGHSPFRAKTTMGVLHRIVNDDPRSLRQINPDVPNWLQSIIGKLLSKSPDKRFQSAAEVADLLERWLAHVQQPDKVAAPDQLQTKSGFAAWPPIAKWLAAAGGFAFLCAALAIIVLETNKGTITIETADNDTKIRIKQGTKTVRELKVTEKSASTRIAAGEYVIEVEGKPDDVTVENGTVTLTRGGKWFAKVVEKIDESKVKKLKEPNKLLADVQKLLGSGDYKDAEKLLQQMMEQDPNGKAAEQALFWMWNSASRQDNLEQAIAIQDEWLQRFPNGRQAAYTKYFRSLFKHQLGKTDEAEKEFQQLLIEHPGSEMARNATKMLDSINQQRIYRNPEEMLKGISIAEMSVNEMMALAGAKMGKQEFGKAQELFAEALKQQPDGKHAKQAMMHLATSKAESGNRQGAVEIYRKWLEKYPEDRAQSLNRYHLGLNLYHMGEADEAMDVFDQIIEREPKSIYAGYAKKILQQIEMQQSANDGGDQ